MADSKKLGISTGRQLYKYLFRECNKLPKDASEFYKFSIKQSFKQHSTEKDSIRIKEIISRAIEDAEWIIKKYNS